MATRFWIACGGLLGALGVIAGSFGAHGLEGTLSTEQLDTFEVAVRYQMYHAVALVLVGLLSLHTPGRMLQAAGLSFLVGILVFSGMLYAWVFTDIRTFALIVPFGGVAFILGWLALAVSGVQASGRQP